MKKLSFEELVQSVGRQESLKNEIVAKQLETYFASVQPRSRSPHRHPHSSRCSRGGGVCYPHLGPPLIGCQHYAETVEAQSRYGHVVRDTVSHVLIISPTPQINTCNCFTALVPLRLCIDIRDFLCVVFHPHRNFTILFFLFLNRFLFCVFVLYVREKKNQCDLFRDRFFH